MISLIVLIAFQEVVLAQLGFEFQILGNLFLAAGSLPGLVRAWRDRDRTNKIPRTPIALPVRPTGAPETPRGKAA